jgi:hypothetical protein
MNWKGCGRRWLWPNLRIYGDIAGGTEGKHVKLSRVVFMTEIGNRQIRNKNEINKYMNKYIYKHQNL